MNYPDPSVYDNGKLRELQHLMNQYHKVRNKIGSATSIAPDWLVEKQNELEKELHEKFGLSDSEFLIIEAQKNKANKFADTFDLGLLESGQ